MGDYQKHQWNEQERRIAQSPRWLTDEEWEAKMQHERFMDVLVIIVCLLVVSGVFSFLWLIGAHG